MGSEPAKHVRESFEKATKSYEERRLEPLPERELSLLEDWVSAVERGEMFAMHESFFVEAAMRNGFRPSEYMDSVFRAKIQQLRQMGLEPENLLPPVPQIRGVDIIHTTDKERRSGVAVGGADPLSFAIQGHVCISIVFLIRLFLHSASLRATCSFRRFTLRSVCTSSAPEPTSFTSSQNSPTDYPSLTLTYLCDILSVDRTRPLGLLPLSMKFIPYQT